MDGGWMVIGWDTVIHIRIDYTYSLPYHHTVNPKGLPPYPPINPDPPPLNSPGQSI